MSIVHRIYDPVLERALARKVLHTDRDTAAARERFLDEARIMGQLEHPNIVPVHAYDEGEDGRDAIRMKLVSGQSFLARIRAQGDARLHPENLTESLQILMKVCDAVAYAHSRGVVHRDLKPSNIMIGDFGEVYVMDWGIALRMQHPSIRGLEPKEPEGNNEESSLHRGVLGTPTFIAPEQIDHPDSVDPRADVYCTGGILYALLTGRAPHQGRTPMLRLLAASHGQIAPPERIVSDGRIPPALARIAMRALSRVPADRHISMGALKADIAAFLHGAWNLVTRSYPDGAVIVAEGDPGHEAFVIQSGRAEVRRAELLIRTLSPGDVFGELAILSQHGLRTSTVRAIGEVHVMVVTREMLADGLGLNSWMGVFVSALAERFAELEAKLAPNG